MNDIFTHNFDFEFKTVNVSGQIEFTPDGAMNMSIQQAGVPITAETMTQILALLGMIQKLTESGGELKLLKIKKKAV